MGSSPFQLQQPFPFFFSHQFFFLIPATGKPPNFFFSFSNKPNKFIKIYFIYFSSSFTHCKTSQKKIFTSFFFFLLNSGPFCPKFLEHLRLHFLDPSIQHLSYAIHQAYNFNHNSYHTSQNQITHHISCTKMHKDA